MSRVNLAIIGGGLVGASLALAPAAPVARGAEFLLVLPAAPDTPAPSSMP